MTQRPCAVTAPCQPGARSTLSACAMSAAAAERAARREGDASASESSHASASYHRTGRAQGDAPGAGLRSSSRCPPQRPGRNETPAGKGSGGCSDDPRRERESAERRSSPVCHPSLHRLPLHRLALQVNSYAILRIVWTKVKHIFWKLLETLRNLVHPPSWSNWRRFRLYFARKSPLWRR